MSAPTLLRQLLDGLDPTTLAVYDQLFELLVEHPGWEPDQRSRAWDRAHRMAEGDDVPHVRQPGAVSGWTSVDEWRTCGRYELALLESTGVREMFVARLPEGERQRLQLRRDYVASPTHSVRVVYGGAELCMTCGSDIAAVNYVAIWDAEIDDPEGGWTVCMPCATRALPVGMPLLQFTKVHW